MSIKETSVNLNNTEPETPHDPDKDAAQVLPEDAPKEVVDDMQSWADRRVKDLENQPI